MVLWQTSFTFHPWVKQSWKLESMEIMFGSPVWWYGDAGAYATYGGGATQLCLMVL